MAGPTYVTYAKKTQNTPQNIKTSSIKTILIYTEFKVWLVSGVVYK